MNIISSFHALLNAFDISKNTLSIPSPSSKDLSLSWVIDNNWWIQESPGLGPDLFAERDLFPIKNFPILLNSNLVRIFLQIVVTTLDRNLPKIVFLLFYE